MQTLFYGWLAAGIILVILEMFTVTLFSISMGIACLAVACYVNYYGIETLQLSQFVIFGVISIILMLITPRFLSPLKFFGGKIGLDSNIGKTYKLKKVGGNWKISINGVDYLVDDECITDGFAENKSVILESNNSGLVVVKLK